MSNTSRRNHIKQGRMVIVADLYKRGWSIARIAEEVRKRLGTTCSTRTIWNDIQSLLKEWRETRIADIEECKQLELERIDDCVAELWTQWDRSKEDWKRNQQKRIGVPIEPTEGDPKNATIHTIRREETTEDKFGMGNPAYIAEIRQQLMERRKILGLYAATKTEVMGKNGEPILLHQMSEEEIKQEIERIRKSCDS